MYCFVSYYCDTVDGYWAEWYEWQQCNVTCAGGVQLRTRDCVKPLHGGLNCTGDDTESQICNENPCPGECVSYMCIILLFIAMVNIQKNDWCLVRWMI